MIATCKEVVLTVNLKKVTKLTTTTNFLRVDIDSVTMEARIDPSCLSETISLLKDISGQHSATKWTILSLVGKLHFVCHVCSLGRAFLCQMTEASMKAQHLYHKIKLNEDFVGTLTGGCNFCLLGMGLAFYTSIIGSPAWSVNFSQMPAM